ncbi:MAG: hypothetical protein AAF151_20380 [Cyanobacteria bacterium J06656_5]
MVRRIQNFGLLVIGALLLVVVMALPSFSHEMEITINDVTVTRGDAAVPNRFDAANWMHDNLIFLADKSLKEIAIIGSHDSGMSSRNGGTEFGTECRTLTQSKNVYEQLLLGARYFDIRPVISGGKYKTGHYSRFKLKDLENSESTLERIGGFLGRVITDVVGGPTETSQGANGQSIQDIIANLNEFTAPDNRSELLILHLSHSLNTDVGNSSYRQFDLGEWKDLFKELEKINYLYVVPNNSTGVALTDITLFDFFNDHRSKVIILVDDTVPSALMDEYQGKGFYYDTSFKIYNEYAGTESVDVMVNDQLKKMEEKAADTYFFLSWTLTQQSFDSDCVVTLADRANAKLKENLPIEGKIQVLDKEISSQLFPNIIYMDNIVDHHPAELALDISKKISTTNR